MKRYRAKNELVVQSSDGIFVAYDATNGTILELNEIGFKVLQACAKPMSVARLCLKLEAECSHVPPHLELLRDVRDFLSQLEKFEFIRSL